jgi:hypothetical protein
MLYVCAGKLSSSIAHDKWQRVFPLDRFIAIINNCQLNYYVTSYESRYNKNNKN